MVAPAPSAPSSLAGLSAQRRSGSRIASDRRGAIEVLPENDDFSRPKCQRPERRSATTCIGPARPHRRDSHRGRRRLSSQPRIGRYSWARYYHPGLQRFIAEDPIGFAGGDTNIYAYVFNTPTTFRDPSGLEPITLSTGAALAIVCAVGAVAGDVVVLTVSGRKTTWAELAAGAGIGCVGGVGVLAAYGAVAGAAAGKVGTGILVTAETMREALLKAAQNPALQRAINELYRPGAKSGDGGTADIARQELAQGLTGHAEKAMNYALHLDRLIRSGVLNAADSHLAKVLRNTLTGAGSGK